MTVIGGGAAGLAATTVADRAGELIHEPVLAVHTGMFTGTLATHSRSPGCGPVAADRHEQLAARHTARCR
ncbi:hypothetical protein [Lentzea roselyniae]|uniref:hypothetical protein n=1 Tax=Lentzea roselyniae TaxID=531940 RepID=UPI0031F8378E